MNIRESGARRTFVMAALLGAREMHVSAVQCAPRFSDPKVWHVCVATDAHLPRDLPTSWTDTDAHLPRDLATSAPGLGHICTETDAPLHRKGTWPHLHRDRCTSAPRAMHICTETDARLHRERCTSAPRPMHFRDQATSGTTRRLPAQTRPCSTITSWVTRQATTALPNKPKKRNKPDDQTTAKQGNKRQQSKQTNEANKQRLRSEANQTNNQTTTQRSKQTSEQTNQASSFGIGGCGLARTEPRRCSLGRHSMGASTRGCTMSNNSRGLAVRQCPPHATQHGRCNTRGAVQTLHTRAASTYPPRSSRSRRRGPMCPRRRQCLPRPSCRSCTSTRMATKTSLI
jgi:hypothetical protein